MATRTLTWDNTAVLANVNATAQRASKRIKAVGGSFNTLNFLPVNDLPTSAITTDANMLLVNRVYEFKIEAICTAGGPTANTNGLKEGIVFDCIVPSLVRRPTEIDVIIDCTGSDLTKGKVVLKKQSDDSVVGTITSARAADSIYAGFTGLIATDAYYCEIELYAVVEGVEVISSDAAYLNAVCGGNIVGYKIVAATGSVLLKNISASGSINSVSPGWFYIDIGAIPVAAGNEASGGHSGYTGSFSVQILGGGVSLKLFINSTEIDCLTITSDGFYTFTGVTIMSGDNVEIRLLESGC